MRRGKPQENPGESSGSDTTLVVDLDTGHEFYYSTCPDEAVVHAFESNKGNNNWWNYLPFHKHPNAFVGKQASPQQLS